MDYAADRIFALLAGGGGFFVGMTATVLCSLAAMWTVSAVPRSLIRLLNLFGMAFVVISATPIPLWAYCLVFALWLTSAFIPKRAPVWKVLSISGYCVFAAALCANEWRYHSVRNIVVANTQTVFVIGDSISAGITRDEITWPAVMAKITGLRVVNLAEPGATVSTALNQIDDVKDSNGVVLIEIGGNDMLEDSDAATFAAQLDTLLKRVRINYATVAMLELPLLPLRNGFGAAQRALAEKYEVALIPKRYMADVFGTRGATSDGLHLTRVGHDLLAKSIADIIEVH